MTIKLKLMQPVTTTNRYGEAHTSYKHVRTIWAEQVKMSGSRQEQVAEHFASYAALFRIRSAHPVREHWQVEQLGGYLYNVEAVEPNTRRGLLTLICSRANP